MNTPQSSPKPTDSPPTTLDVGLGVITRSLTNGRQQVLITQRRHDSVLPGLWEIPGGKREPKESLPQTVARELHEELGVQVQVDSQIGTWEHTYPHATVRLHAYWCAVAAGNPQPLEVADLAWVDPADLLSYPFPEASLELIEIIAETLR